MTAMGHLCGRPGLWSPLPLRADLRLCPAVNRAASDSLWRRHTRSHPDRQTRWPMKKAYPHMTYEEIDGELDLHG
jgi:hypothetical protein